MSFKYSVIGDNTAENREWLIQLGYNPSIEFDPLECSLPILLTCGNHDDLLCMACEENEGLIEDEIDARGNDPLFRALTAVRDDSDYIQWFTNGVHWCKCYFLIFSHFAFHQKVEASMDLLINWHKATSEELIEHFKN